MARFKDAHWRPLDSGHQVAMTRYDLVILHTMVGNLTGTDNMFAKNGWSGTESHFGVGGPWGDDKDGVIYQWNDTKWRSDANLEANDRAISIETGDNAPKFTKDVKPWTEKQLDAIVDIVAWACLTHDIPAVLVPDSKPTRRGIAFHQQGCEHSDGIGSHPDFLVAGGERWSTSLGKECPTAARIEQVKKIIVPRVAARLRGEDDMPTEKEFKSWMKDVLQDKTLVANLDADKATIGTMSIVRALELGDYKADQDWAADRDQSAADEAQTALLERIAAQVAADTNLNQAEIDKVVAAVKAAVTPPAPEEKK